MHSANGWEIKEPFGSTSAEHLKYMGRRIASTHTLEEHSSGIERLMSPLVFRATLVLMPVLATGMPSLCLGSSDQPSVTPYRPTVSNPAALSEPDWLEMETGFSHNHGGDARTSDSLPYLLKYAVSSSFGVLVGGDVFIKQTDLDGKHLSGRGDTSILLKHRWSLGADDGPAFGLEYGVNLPTARKGLGSDKADYTANGIYSTTLGENSIDLNLNVTRIGAIASGEGRFQLGYAATLSRALNGRWGIAAEISGDSRKGVPPANQFLFAGSYAPSNRIVLDAGTSIGVSKAAPDWSIFAGVSLLLEKMH